MHPLTLSHKVHFCKSLWKTFIAVLDMIFLILTESLALSTSFQNSTVWKLSLCYLFFKVCLDHIDPKRTLLLRDYYLCFTSYWVTLGRYLTSQCLSFSICKIEFIRVNIKRDCLGLADMKHSIMIATIIIYSKNMYWGSTAAFSECWGYNRKQN